MIRYRKVRRHNITVVFDGYKSGRGNEHRSVIGGVAVIYSGLGERADEVIKRIITDDRMEWLVVSSDKEIARCAWAVNSVAVPSDEFVRVVSRESSGRCLPSKNGNEADEYDDTSERKDSDEEETGHACKGNPYRLSKRERSVRRALSKL